MININRDLIKIFISMYSMVLTMFYITTNCVIITMLTKNINVY